MASMMWISALALLAISTPIYISVKTYNGEIIWDSRFERTECTVVDFKIENTTCNYCIRSRYDCQPYPCYNGYIQVNLNISGKIVDKWLKQYIYQAKLDELNHNLNNTYPVNSTMYCYYHKYISGVIITDMWNKIDAVVLSILLYLGEFMIGMIIYGIWMCIFTD